MYQRHFSNSFFLLTFSFIFTLPLTFVCRKLLSYNLPRRNDFYIYKICIKKRRFIDLKFSKILLTFSNILIKKVCNYTSLSLFLSLCLFLYIKFTKEDLVFYHSTFTIDYPCVWQPVTEVNIFPFPISVSILTSPIYSFSNVAEKSYSVRHHLSIYLNNENRILQDLGSMLGLKINIMKIMEQSIKYRNKKFKIVKFIYIII